MWVICERFSVCLYVSALMLMRVCNSVDTHWMCLFVCVFSDVWLHIKSGIPTFAWWVLRWSIVAKLGCKVVTASHEAQSATHRETVSLMAVCGADKCLMDDFIQSLKCRHTHRGRNVRNRTVKNLTEQDVTRGMGTARHKSNGGCKFPWGLVTHFQ